MDVVEEIRSRSSYAGHSRSGEVGMDAEKEVGADIGCCRCCNCDCAMLLEEGLPLPPTEIKPEYEVREAVGTEVLVATPLEATVVAAGEGVTVEDDTASPLDAAVVAIMVEGEEEEDKEKVEVEAAADTLGGRLSEDIFTIATGFIGRRPSCCCWWCGCCCRKSLLHAVSDCPLA